MRARMNEALRTAFEAELRAAATLVRQRSYPPAFDHLERAHILGQRFAAAHVRVHAWMLRVGWARRDWREIAGQVLRLSAAGPLSLLGWLPIGNTGGANVSALRPMPPPADLARLLDDTDEEIA